MTAPLYSTGVFFQSSTTGPSSPLAHGYRKEGFRLLLDGAGFKATAAAVGSGPTADRTAASHGSSVAEVSSGARVSVTDLPEHRALPAAPPVVAASMASQEGLPAAATVNSATGFTAGEPGVARAVQVSAAAVRAAGASAGAARAYPLWTADASWSRQAIHVVVSDQGVKAWVRDASLSEAGGRQLADRLRTELRLRYGLELSQFSVNGVPQGTLTHDHREDI